MGNNRHLLHVKSNVVENGIAKLPTSDDILYGELAINYAKDNETISLKNSENEIVSLNMHNIVYNVNVNGVSGKVTDHIAYVAISGHNENVGTYSSVQYPEAFSGKASNVKSDITISSAFTNVEKTISALTQEVLDNELVVEKAIDALSTAAGTIDADGEITYISNDSANYINNAISLADADDILDNAIKSVDDKVENIKTSYITGGSISSSTSYSAVVENGVLKLTVPKAEAQHIYSGDSNWIEIDGTDKVKWIGSGGTAIVTNGTAHTVSFSGDLTTKDGKIYIVDAKTNTTIGSGLTIPESGKVDNIEVNGVSGTVENKIAKVTLHGHDVKIDSGFTATTYPSAFTSNYSAYNVETADTINEAVNKIEKTISSLTQSVLDDEEVFSNALEKTAIAVGHILDDDGKIVYVPDTTCEYIGTAYSLHSADVILDQKISELEIKINQIIEVLKRNDLM